MKRNVTCRVKNRKRKVKIKIFKKKIILLSRFLCRKDVSKFQLFFYYYYPILESFQKKMHDVEIENLEFHENY